MSERRLSDCEVTVRRSLRDRWYLSLVGIVMVLHGGGVLFGWLPTRRLLEWLYPGREAPGFESRDMIWATSFIVVGMALIVWTAGRLLAKRPVVLADAGGLILSSGPPFRRSLPIPWDWVREISTGVVSDDYGKFPTLLVRLDDPSLLVFVPWGARWVGDGVLSISAAGWNIEVEEVVERLMEVRVAWYGALVEDAEAQETGMEVDMPQLSSGASEAGEGTVIPVGGNEIDTSQASSGASEAGEEAAVPVGDTGGSPG